MDGSSFKFFRNEKCEYFPCHENVDREEFNCMFCFCPLYALGAECGGDFTYTGGGIKDCSSCTIPHGPDGYEHVTLKFEKIKEMAGRKDG